MLFLFNDRVIDVDLPELRLARRWRTLGCGDPLVLRAREAIDFARAIVDQANADGAALSEETQHDIAALVIAKTGANAVQFIPRMKGASEPRLSSVPEEALQAFSNEVDRDEQEQRAQAWNWSAA